MRERSGGRACHVVLVLLWLVSAETALGQTTASQCGDSSRFYRAHTALRPDAHRVNAEFPSFVLRKLPPQGPASVEALRAELRACAWRNVRTLLFSDADNPDYVDWIVYVDSLGAVRQSLVGPSGTSHVLPEQRYIWVMVFTDHDLRVVHRGGRDALAAASGEVAGTPDVHVTRRVVIYRPDPLLTSLVRGVGKAVSITPPTDALLNDSTQALTLEDLSTDSSTATLYLVQGRFGLVPNAQVELSVMPVAGKAFVDPPQAEVAPGAIRSIYTDVADVKRSRAELSVAAASTLGPPEKTYDASGTVKTTSPGSQLNAYLAGMLNLPLSVALPWQHPSWRRSYFGVGVGTNIARGSFGDEFLVLGALSRIVSDVGLVAGADWQTEQSFVKKQIVNRRKPRFVVGLDVRL